MTNQEEIGLGLNTHASYFFSDRDKIRSLHLGEDLLNFYLSMLGSEKLYVVNPGIFHEFPNVDENGKPLDDKCLERNIPGGASTSTILATSHANSHTWLEHYLIRFDISACANPKSGTLTERFLYDHLQPNVSVVHRIPDPLAPIMFNPERISTMPYSEIRTLDDGVSRTFDMGPEGFRLMLSYVGDSLRRNGIIK